MVGELRHKKVTPFIPSDAHRSVEAGVAVCPVGAAVAPGPSGHCAHHPGRRNLADGVVAGIRDIDIACAVNRDTISLIEPRLAVGPVGGAPASGQPGQSRHHALGVDLPDGIVVTVGDVHVTHPVRSHPAGKIEMRASISAVGAADRQRCPGHCTGDPIVAAVLQLPDGRVFAVGK
jgi:hypothetical protein